MVTCNQPVTLGEHISRRLVFARSIPRNGTIICVTWHSLNGNIFKRCIAFGSMLEKAKRSCTRLLQFFEVTKSFACWVKELRTRCKLLVKTFYLKRSFQADKNRLWWFKDFESLVYKLRAPLLVLYSSIISSAISPEYKIIPDLLNWYLHLLKQTILEAYDMFNPPPPPGGGKIFFFSASSINSQQPSVCIRSRWF